MPNRVHTPSYTITDKELEKADRMIARIENAHPEIIKKWMKDIDAAMELEIKKLMGYSNDNM